MYIHELARRFVQERFEEPSARAVMLTRLALVNAAGIESEHVLTGALQC
jgi:hypothetical protein